MYILFIFGLASKVFPVIFNTLSALISIQDKICRKCLFTVFAACGTDWQLPFYDVKLYKQ